MTLNFSEDRSKLVALLFQTEAFQVCPQGEPFWYTSGTIGPYFINTHYLYGSKGKAEELLNFIEDVKGDKDHLSELIFEKVLENYDENDIFHTVIDELVDLIKKKENIDSIDYISGGERRDWFFSIIVAYILKKSHITIFKDMAAIVWDSTTRKQFPINHKHPLKDKKILHIADLVTEASSYERVWIPAIKKVEAKMISTFVIIDRMQGGRELLENHNVHLSSLIDIDISLFKSALDLGLIGGEQLDMLKDYFVNPFEAMKKFLVNNPDFLERSLKSNEKNKERAELCVRNKIYE